MHKTICQISFDEPLNDASNGDFSWAFAWAIRFKSSILTKVQLLLDVIAILKKYDDKIVMYSMTNSNVQFHVLEYCNFKDLWHEYTIHSRQMLALVLKSLLYVCCCVGISVGLNILLKVCVANFKTKLNLNTNIDWEKLQLSSHVLYSVWGLN